MFIDATITPAERTALAVAFQRALDGSDEMFDIVDAGVITREDLEAVAPQLQVAGAYTSRALLCSLHRFIGGDGVLHPDDLANVVRRLGSRVWPVMHPGVHPAQSALVFSADLMPDDRQKIVSVLEKTFGQGPNYRSMIDSGRITATTLGPLVAARLQTLSTQQQKRTRVGTTMPPLQVDLLLGGLNRTIGYDGTVDPVDVDPFVGTCTMLVSPFLEDLADGRSEFDLGQPTFVGDEDGTYVGRFSGGTAHYWMSETPFFTDTGFGDAWAALFDSAAGVEQLNTRAVSFDMATRRLTLTTYAYDLLLSATVERLPSELASTAVRWVFHPYDHERPEKSKERRFQDLDMVWRLGMVAEIGGTYLYTAAWSGCAEYGPSERYWLQNWEESNAGLGERVINGALLSAKKALLQKISRSNP